MTSEQVAAISAVAVAVPVAIGLYLVGRLRQRDLQLGRDGLVCAGIAGAGLVLVLSAREQAIFALGLPALLAGLGVYMLVTKQPIFLKRTIGLFAVAGGLLGFLLGVVRFAMR